MNSQDKLFERKSSLKQITEEDKKIIAEIIKYIKSDPKSTPFLYPVDIKANPNYLRIIKYNPMDISTIEKKLSKNEYALVQDVINDIKLIWYNCRIYNYENSEIYQFSDYLEKIVDKKFEIFYIYYDKVNKSVNYKEQFEKNAYNEDEFNDPDYLEKNSSDILNENEKKYYAFLYYKLKLKKLISSLTNNERKNLFNKINEKDDKNKNELYILNKYIEKNKENNIFFKFHIEMMNKEDILLLINYINKNFNVKFNENNY